MCLSNKKSHATLGTTSLSSIMILACHFLWEHYPLFCRKNLRAARLSDLVKVFCSKISLNRFRLKLRRNFTVEFASNPSRSSIKSSVSLQGIFFPPVSVLKLRSRIINWLILILIRLSFTTNLLRKIIRIFSGLWSPSQGMNQRINDDGSPTESQ
jgi:hypothetical protein